MYVDTYGYPVDDEGLRLELKSLYTPESLKECLLDGFFWSIPFDADPYSTSLNMQEKEQEKTYKFEKTVSVQKKSKFNAQKQNKKEADINYCPVPTGYGGNVTVQSAQQSVKDYNKTAIMLNDSPNKIAIELPENLIKILEQNKGK